MKPTRFGTWLVVLLVAANSLFYLRLTSVAPKSDEGTPTVWDQGIRYRSITMSTTYPCGSRSFPHPKRDSGLPWLFDAFASPTAEHVLFVGKDTGKNDTQIQDRTSSLWNQTTSTVQKQFLCRYQGQTEVISEPVRVVYGDTGGGSLDNSTRLVIRCPIPEDYRSYVIRGQSETALFVNLHALADTEDPNSSTPRSTQQTPFIPYIAVCHRKDLPPGFLASLGVGNTKDD